MSPGFDERDVPVVGFPRVSGDEPMNQLREAAIQAVFPA